MTYPLLMAINLAIVPITSQAQTTAENAVYAPSERQYVSIPAQSLEEAIRAYAKQTGVQIAYSSHLLKDLTSQAIKGTFTPEQALDRLLRSSGLTYKKSAANTYILKAPVRLMEKESHQLQDVYVTANKLPEKLSEADASVAIETSETIDEKSPPSSLISSVMNRVSA